MIKCCKDCVPPKRYPGCHDRCQEYLEEKRIHDEIKQKRYEENQITGGLREQSMRLWRRNHKKGQERKY